MGKLYQKLKARARGCRDRDVRIKLELILLGLKLGNVGEACARRGFSRKFYYKWFKRFRKSGWNLRALEEQSRRPRWSPLQTTPEIEKKILWLHRRQYGARMIQAMLRRGGIKLTQTTICHILNHRRVGKKKRKSWLKPHRRRYELVIPGQRFQLDVKYVPEFVEGRRMYAFVAVDECTRWRFAWTYGELSPTSTCDFLDRLEKHSPFPIHTIQTDNGFEFTHRFHPDFDEATSREHRMDEWCRTHDVIHRLIPPGVKELNGKVERSHRIDEQYFYWQAPTDTLEHFLAHQQLWMNHYNRSRLHGGIGYLTPWEKLYERLQVLQATLPASPDLWHPELIEELRLRFIRQAPKRIQEQQRQQPFKLKISASQAFQSLQKLKAA